MIRSTRAATLFLAVTTLGAAVHGRQGLGAYDLQVPASYVAGAPAPLLLLLHGYSSSGAQQEAYMRFMPLADEFGFLYLHPNGAVDSFNNRFWNATDACCDFNNTGIDHSGILAALIDSTKASFSVDDRRVWFVGHSNGGFMSYRMACEHADTIAAIVSLAGATFKNPADCVPSEPVHVLQIHGTNDGTIQYNGGNIAGVPYPGAIETVERWASYDGCALVPDHSAPNIDLDGGIAGNETTVTRYESACASGGSAELWSIQGGSHVPNLSATFSRQVVEYLYAHPKPAFASTYCQSTPNSSGAAATMDALGSSSISANDLGLVASDLPASQTGLFYYGAGELSLPFGNGTRCVGSGGVGVFRFGVQNSGAAGVLYLAVDYGNPPRPAGQISAGSTWKFQAWFRDPMGGGSFFDLSDGLSIDFGP
jgi:polyhydroxybutyrate depolymerase